ncbi:MAG: Gfo/Idh/MocA family protein [Stellaceae bacterium]
MLDVAVIGLGWWGKTIATTLHDSRKLRVVHAVDVDAATGTWARERGIRFSTSLDGALTDSVVRAVILCTPHSLHTAQIARVAAAKKHVFCEKPLALKQADAAASVRVCNDHGVMLGVGHERRFEPPMIELTRLAKAGALGRLLQVEASFCQNKMVNLPADNWRQSPAEAPAGPLTATGIHLLDLSVSFLGAPESALCRARQLGSPLANGDTLGALVAFKDGGVALINAILATPFAGRFTLYGTRGWAEIRDKSHPEQPTGWTLTTCAADGTTTVVDYPAASSVRANLEAFADAVEGWAAYPMPQAEMIATIAALEAVVTSSTTGAVAHAPMLP